MKRTIRCAAAAVLALTLIGGGLPLIPGAKPIADFSVSVSAAEWYQWDEVNGVLTLNGQLPDTSEGNNLAVLAGIAPANVKKVVIKSGTKTGTSACAMFDSFENLTEIEGLVNLDTSNATSMKKMFSFCNHLTSLDLSGFDTSNVTTMFWMFTDCESLTSLDLSGFDTSNVTNMLAMFGGCYALTSLDLSGFDTSSVTDMEEMFVACTNLTSLDISGFDTSNVTTMLAMFEDCSKLTSIDISSFDTSKVENMSAMFRNCSSLETVKVSEKWNTAAAIYSDFMFAGCTKIVGGADTVYDGTKLGKEYARIDKGASEPGYFTAAIDRTVTYVEDTTLHLVGEFNGTDTNNSIDKALANAGKAKTDITEIVAETGAKFPADSRNLFHSFTNTTTIDLKNADTSSVTDMHGMFFGCTSLTDLDVSGFDTSHVTSAYDMFFNCSSLTTIDLSSFDTSKIIDMGGMFSGCSSLSSIDLSGFVTTGVTGSFAGMFSNCSSLTTLDLSSFDTSNVTSIHSMFGNCSSLTSLDLSGFDTSSLISADHLFAGCSSLTSVDLTGFDTSKIGFMAGMFYGCSSLTELDLSDFDTGTVTNTERMFQNCSSLKTITVSDKWTTDSVTDSNDMFKNCTALTGGHGTAFDSAKTDAEYAVIDGKGGSKGYLTDIAETVTYVDTSNVLHLVGEFNGTDTNNSIDKALANAGKAKTDITEIVAETGAKFPVDSSSLFYQFSNVTDIDLSNASTVGVTDMSSMFGYCSKLKTLDVSGFDTSGVTDICSMFFNCFELESLDLSGFDTSKVTDMTFLFNHCDSMTSLDLTGLDTSSVTNMSSMFYDCSALQTLDVSHFDTSNVTKMEMMFTDCSALTSLDLSGFDTSNVTDMNTMFAFCSELTALDLSDFDTSKVEKMDGMFGSCSKLKTITVSDKWTTDQVTNSGLMFTDCTAIVGGNGTVFDSAKTDAEYAVIDGKGGKKGYLTGDLVKVTGLSLDKTSLELTVGDTATLTAEVIPDNADNRNVSWKTSSPAIATVNGGVVTATDVGIAVITATSEDGGYKVTCVVNVTPVPDAPAPSLPVVVSASPKIGTGGVGTGEARAEENYTFSAVAMNNTLVWDSLPGADKFIISARKKGDTQWKRVGTTDSMEYDLSGMEAGTYTFIVRYVKGDFTAPARLSARVNAKVGSNKPVVTAKTADGKVILRWKAVPGADKYRIYTFTDGRLKKVGDTAKTSVRVKGEKGDRFAVKAYINGKWSKVTKKDIASAE